tara:strand:+ start:226 stop:1026 length:801 start_codon:yes stop_codon:yes gene_type:complete
MKAISLVFEYDFNKQVTSGRTWGKTGYKTKDFIFEYSAASFATFAHHNPGLDHEVMTDDKNLLEEKISKYNVDWSGLKIIDASSKIQEWKKHRYCFYPAMMHLKEYEDVSDQLIKLDNDLECLKPLQGLEENTDILFWKHERNVNKGREYWGEREASRRAFGTDDYQLYNMGVTGFPRGDKKDMIREMVSAGLKMSEVDISNVVHFPERPDLKVKIWSCSEQTGYCYTVHKRNCSVTTVEDYIHHHCYGFDSKKQCVDSAKHLLKR